MRKLLIYSSIILCVIFLFGCNRNSGTKQPVDTPTETVEKEQYIKIMTTNKLLYSMVKDIVKDRHLVDYMLKTEEDQWNFKYTEDSISNVAKKDLFMYFGASYEPWVPGFIEKVEKSKVGIINISRGTRLISLSKPRKYITNEKIEIEYKENPYYWLNIDDYKIALSNIKNAIQERDPKNRDIYEVNFNEAIKALEIYSKDIEKARNHLSKYTFVTVEDDFDYFIKFMNLKTVKIDASDLEEANAEKLLKKFEGAKDIVLLYGREDNIKPYAGIISKYNMKSLNLITYKFHMNINEIYKHNFEAVSSLVNANK